MRQKNSATSLDIAAKETSVGRPDRTRLSIPSHSRLPTRLDRKWGRVSKREGRAPHAQLPRLCFTFARSSNEPSIGLIALASSSQQVKTSLFTHANLKIESRILPLFRSKIGEIKAHSHFSHRRKIGSKAFREMSGCALALDGREWFATASNALRPLSLFTAACHFDCDGHVGVKVFVLRVLIEPSSVLCRLPGGVGSQRLRRGDGPAAAAKGSLMALRLH